jgi:hypothetical protein
VANQKQKYMRRKMAQSITYLQKSIDALLEVKELFVEFHPEWDSLFIAIANSCVITIGLIKSLCEKAWGYFPDNLETWLK